MNYLVLLDATAGSTAGQGGSFSGQGGFLIMMLLIFGVMYFLMIRPQQKKQKEQRKFRDNLQKGDKVVTAGGIYGKIEEVSEQIVKVKVAENTIVKFDKSCILPDYTDLSKENTPAK